MVFERYQLDGKVAIVTGAGRGLGRAMALALARAGAHVAAVARTDKDVRATADAIREAGRRGLALTTNVTDSDAVEQMVAQVATEFGGVDILVNGAGGEFGAHKPATEVSDAEWLEVLMVNLTGSFYCARTVGQRMLARGWGRVINIACIYGTRGSINHAAYAAAKGGVLQLTQALALEWAKGGVTVNTLGIGWFAEQDEAQGAPRNENLVRAIPVRRLGQSLDVETALVYLASDASRYMTGQTIWLDGGILCR